MIPSIDERLASIVRSLSEVVLPHLPPDASLAQEQVHLAIGHLQILRAQFDQVPEFEREELADAVALGTELCRAGPGGPATSAAVKALEATIAPGQGGHVREQAKAVNRAIDALVQATAAEGDTARMRGVSDAILAFEKVRVEKDRAWFLPFGFDTL